MSIGSASQDCYSVARQLVHVDEACRMVSLLAPGAVDTEIVPLRRLVGRDLAHDVVAPVPLPIFDHSAMDGYAVRVLDFQGMGSTTLPVIGRQVAGAPADPLAHGTARRVLTGAPLPLGADAVVMQERCRREGHLVHFCELPARWDNIRRRGEDISDGEVVLQAGQRLDARHVAVLAALGISEVMVRRQLRISVLSSGSELVEPSARPSAGQIFDCNRPMLLALLAKPNVLVSDGGCFPDDPFALAGALKRASRTADLVLMSGGTADGDEDHSIRAILLAGGKARHLHVALKPGKPSIIGRLGDTVVIGLPGNPIAALVNCLLLGQSAIEALFGRNSERPKGLPAVSIKPYRHARGRTEFSPARIVNRSSERVEIEILGRGGSARFAPLLSAEGLAEIASSTGDIAAGGAVRFHSFPAFRSV